MMEKCIQAALKMVYVMVMVRRNGKLSFNSLGLMEEFTQAAIKMEYVMARVNIDSNLPFNS